MPPRNKHFHSHLREPFKDDKLTLTHAEGPVGFLNPTKAHFHYPVPSGTEKQLAKGDESENSDVNGYGDDNRQQPNEQQDDEPAKNVKFLWRSRDNRKGRHALLVQRPQEGDDAPFLVPRQTSHYKEVLKVIRLTFTYFPVWDISWLVAFIFTLGSVVWVLNGFFVWLPVVAPSTEFDNEIYVGGGVTAFLGAIIFFEFGSILLFFEAVNTNNSGCFGWAVEQLVEEKEGGQPKFRLSASVDHCRHHHQNRRNFVGKSSYRLAEEAQLRKQTTKEGKSWMWFPSWHDLRTHYLHELGFLAGISQLTGATIFGVAGFTALPGIQNHLTPQWRLNAAYWIPQVVGGTGFIVSSTLYMLETQKKWWKPAFNVLGWHIGFWNLIGAFGFTLSGALGMAYGNSGAQYEAGLATFWGSWAFLIGSYLQLYESLDTHPVEEVSSTEDFNRAQ
ncbi:hypothetical protein LTR10_016386 [Elasticomyces elasticus]|uniref:Integral membrane protein n=1 Tax=Exophiala sideris TaxID=1016849 RepID=A0ABR0J6X7_9EURO|nr:hypothetical protein LTR10_016386 [Elasticomyces elasticus]KAK5028396.1 hypothetical protein LTS07_006487 [Exophiala sideris]KAK5035961.1 hypothetical protein LTR13_005531 [Exophiala sideris]KAK5056997.1 hypothetical protein LTR69_007635 [Exophiala sideris]KAK5181404.1 hypothetical protein LTR44_006199 [Eurotiomycetes sp. CCFEE 6388]